MSFFLCRNYFLYFNIIYFYIVFKYSALFVRYIFQIMNVDRMININTNKVIKQQLL